ncbi:hypothetical protein TNCV_2907401 [Trichonephila clavipes]|nr:hypothetical protein TNCV_2907401 [Trichonephila clavipes]
MEGSTTFGAVQSTRQANKNVDEFPITIPPLENRNARKQQMGVHYLPKLQRPVCLLRKLLPYAYSALLSEKRPSSARQDHGIADIVFHIF